MSVPNTTYRVLVEKIGGSDPSQFVGNEGEVFYDPDAVSPVLKLSDGSTPGGVSFGGGGAANTGNITFSNERIIGDINDNFGYGVIQLTPSLDNPDSSQFFVTNGQYVNVYPTIADDAPHIHITAGTLNPSSVYYDELNNYYKGDLFVGDDIDYLSVRGNGEIRINSNTFSGQINFNAFGSYNRNVLNLDCEGNDIDIYNEGVDFDNDYALARGVVGYIGVGSSEIIYTSKMYESNDIGSLKLLVQCKADSGDCQLSELLIVRPYGGTNVFMNETGRVTGIGTSAHVTFNVGFTTVTNQIEVYADTSSDPNNNAWSFRIMPIEIRDYID